LRFRRRRGPNVSHFGAAILATLWHRDAETWVSVESVARKHAMSPATLSRALVDLKDAELVGLDQVGAQRWSCSRTGGWCGVRDGPDWTLDPLA
jgi:hypothetical protein